ncbi:hypothetical protein KC973_03205 [Candidatus Saccharibacteria bacterium]|nr:hypothetical protein [Candidatus Saccharibacteria bacterium]
MAESGYYSGDYGNPGVERRRADAKEAEHNWYRLAQLALSDLFHESGLYDGLSRSQKKQLNRDTYLALHPDAKRTRREKRNMNRHYEPGFPLWSIPILLAVGGAALGFEVLEKYAQTGKLGSKTINHISDREKMHATLNEALNKELSGVVVSALQPEWRASGVALVESQEPTDYVIAIDDLLGAAEAEMTKSGANAEMQRARVLSAFYAEFAPNPLTLQDQRVHAAATFLGSNLLRDGKLANTRLERHAQYLADGPSTFRLRVTHPYTELYENAPDLGDLTHTYEHRPGAYADELVDPDPVVELVKSSRV